MQEHRSTRKARVGCLGTIIGSVALMFVAVGLSYALDCLLNPWAHSITGRSPTLTGEWVGQIITPSGQMSGLFLELHRSTNSKGGYSTCRTCPRIKGTAKLCGGGYVVSNYEVSGGPDNWDGSQFHLNNPRIVGQPQPGLQFGSIRGDWAGDELKLSMKFSFRNQKSDVYASDNIDINTATRFTMKRGGEPDFQALCAQVAR